MLLHVENLSIHLHKNGQQKRLVRHVNFTLEQNQCLGILGESGSGKSLTSYAINGLLGEQFLLEGAIWFNGNNLSEFSPEKRRKMRGRNITMILQSPMTAFNPLFTIGNHVQETLCRHMAYSPAEAIDSMADAFCRVNLRNPKDIFSRYPHELSGGMLQRIMISFAVALQPELLIADEPTTAIDYISQKEVINELQKIRENYQTSILFISHDSSLVSHIADKVLVMHQGSVVEQEDTQQIFTRPENEHTQYLINTRKKLIHGFTRMMRGVHAY